MRQFSYVFCFYFLIFCGIQAQENKELEVLTFQEYIGYVKQYHPLAKMASLQIDEATAKLVKARGGFDPKITVDYDRKKFKSTTYYDQLNATFKIPTWYGVEFKANFEENSGVYLDPSLTVPEDGLYSAGVSLSLVQGLLTNERMAVLRKAKAYQNQAEGQRDLEINELLLEAGNTYLDWVKAVNEEKIYTDYLQNAEQRFVAVRQSYEAGDKAAIDTTEAKITWQNRNLGLKEAQLKVRKAQLKVSNYLWIQDVPVELQPSVLPRFPEDEVLERSLSIMQTDTTNLWQNHPKIRTLEAKINGLKIDRNLKLNKLLPKLELQYNFLSTAYDDASSFNTSNYKAGVNFSFPLFLRKERGNLRLAKIKLNNADFQIKQTRLTLQNKVRSIEAEISNLAEQILLTTDLVVNYNKMVNAETRKFEMGDSSLFLINSREKSLIEARLKQNALQIKSLSARASLLNALGVALGG